MDTNSNAIHDEKSVNASSSGTGSGEPVKESRQDAAAGKQVQDQKAADETPAVENEAGSGAVECSNAEAEACKKELEKLTKEMKAAAKLLEFEHAAYLRDKIKELQEGK